MRPTKLTYKLLDAYRSVLADELAAIAFTEEELVWQANQHLALEEQISYRTFQRYKADILGREAGEPSPNGSLASDKPSPNLSQRERDCPAGETVAPLVLSPEEQEVERANTELVRQMHITLKSALMKQKIALVRGMNEGAPNWRRYSWMLERKFPDFRLKGGERSEKSERSMVDGRQSTEKGNNQSTSNQSTNQPTPKSVASQSTKPELTPLELIAKKWQRCTGHPWFQGPDFYQFHHTPERVREREEEMAEDVAKGYMNPWADLGYVPVSCPDDMDYNTYENGWYTFFTMGTEKGPRLPIRLWARKQIMRAPKQHIKELIWAEQEWERQHPGVPYTGEKVPVEAWPEYPWPERLPPADPEDPEPDRPYRGGARIYGISMGQ